MNQNRINDLAFVNQKKASEVSGQSGIADDITSMTELENWVTEHLEKNPYYWIP